MGGVIHASGGPGSHRARAVAGATVNMAWQPLPSPSEPYATQPNFHSPAPKTSTHTVVKVAIEGMCGLHMVTVRGNGARLSLIHLVGRFTLPRLDELTDGAARQIVVIALPSLLSGFCLWLCGRFGCSLRQVGGSRLASRCR